MSNFDDVVILIPAYNEGKAIKTTIDAIPHSFRHIICVDDGSTDDTRKQIAQTRARLLCHTINLGQGAALQTAIEYALQGPYEYFVSYDADGQHHIQDVEHMLEVIHKEKVDMVLGSRFLGEIVNASAYKKLILKAAIAFSNSVTGVKLTDTHNGLRVFTRHTAQALQLQLPDFAHATEIIERIAQKKFSYREVPVTITYTDYSRTKGQSMINSVNIAFDIMLGRIIKL